MKVAMLGSFPPLRGISSYCLELANSVAAVTCQLDFLSFKKMYPRHLYPGGDLDDDNTFALQKKPGLRVSRKLTWYNPLSWIGEGLKTDAAILHAQWWSLPLAPVYLCICLLFKIRRRPVVFTVHNVMPHEKSAVFLCLSRLLFALGDHFIVHSGQNRKQLIEHYFIPPSAISHIPHGPLDFQANPNIDRKQIRDALDILPEHKIVLLFGAIRPYKGIDTAIDAFAQVVRQIPSARLLVVGKRWQPWQTYEALIRRHGLERHIITVAGYIPTDEVYRFFYASDLVVLPYHHFDSQSGVGAAAISFRKPLIVSRVGGLPDLVLDPHAVVPPADPDALAGAISNCLGSPEQLKKMTKDADSIAQMLSWESIAIRTIAVYRKLLAQASPSRRQRSDKSTKA